jgi:lysophospholipase L1-like esterase
MKPWLRDLVAMAMLAGAFVGTSTAGASGDATFYLSLGDSLAAGIQPPYTSTANGYANQLYRHVREGFTDLRLSKLGCPEESTDTMIRGGICAYPNGSQLDQALAFLHQVEGRVEFITINIGANDVLGTDGVSCWDERSGLISLDCVQGELPGIQSNLSYILEQLQAAAPEVPILGMSYYDPFIGFWILGRHGHGVARSNEESWGAFNDGLVQTYQDEGAAVADVRGPDGFDTANFTDRILTEEWGWVPANVAHACSGTWFCVPCPACPDVHPTTEGYGVIAAAFEAVLDR